MSNLAVAAEIRALLVALARSEMRFDAHTVGFLESYVAHEIYKAVKTGNRDVLAHWLAFVPRNNS